MLGIVIITHGNLSNSLLETAELIMGKQEDVKAVAFTAKESLDTLRLKANEAIDAYSKDGCLVLTDIMGGSATNVCVELTKSDFVEVLTGVNLPMLLEAIGYRSNTDVKALATKIKDSGVRSIINLRDFFEKRAKKK